MRYITHYTHSEPQAKQLTGIERIVGCFRINAMSYPLGDNFLLALIDRASRMCCHPTIHDIGFWIYITKKDGTSSFWLDVHICNFEIRVSTTFWDFAE
jgi:hypothetical protein